MILDIRRIAIREVANDVGKFCGSCQAIFTDVLGMRRAAAKNIPNMLILSKTTFHEHRSEHVDDIQRRFRFDQKDHNL